MEYGAEITAVVVVGLRILMKYYRRKKKKEQAINEISDMIVKESYKSANQSQEKNFKLSKKDKEEVYTKKEDAI